MHDVIAQPVPEASEQIAEGDLFRAWFEHTYLPAGPFLRALLDVGVDPANLKRRYTSRQFVETVTIIRRFAHVNQDDDTAYLEIGRTLMRAFFDTPGGTLLGVVLRLLPARTFLYRITNYLRIARPNVPVEATDLPNGGVRLDVFDPDGCPANVFIGAVDEALTRTGTRGRFLRTSVGPGRMLLDVTWD